MLLLITVEVRDVEVLTRGRKSVICTRHSQGRRADDHIGAAQARGESTCAVE